MIHSTRFVRIIAISIFFTFANDLIAQQKIENEIISSIIKNEFRARQPDTIFSRRGKIKKIKYYKIPDIVLVRETQTNTHSHSNDSVIIEYLKSELKGFDTDIYYDYKGKNSHPEIVDSIKGYQAKIYYTSEEELNRILDHGHGWMSYYRKYHYSPFVEISRPGMNKLQNKALVFFSRVYAPLSGTGVFLLLEFENSEWIVKSWSLVWIS